MSTDDELRILRAEIRADLERTEEIVAAVGRVLSSLAGGRPDEVQVAALGSFLHGFYTAIESIFLRIAKIVDGSVPTGPSWHRDLLERACLSIEGLRPAVVDGEFAEKLREYLAFRHFFRHAYGTRLNWEKMENKLAGMSEVFARVKDEVEKFCDLLLGTAPGHGTDPTA